jgi:hypothetical protein
MKMPMSEAKKKANAKWNKAHPYERASLLLTEPNEKEAVMRHAASQGISPNAYINMPIERDMKGEQ